VSSAEPFPSDLPPAPRPPYGCFLIAGLILLAGVGVAVYLYSRPSPSLEGITASAGRLTLEKDDGADLKWIDRKSGPELWYRVTLRDVPLGIQLDLQCDWIDPAGTVVHRNRYQTRTIDKAVWPTHAKCRIRPDAPTGTWTVKLSLEGRVLHSTTFEVRDGPNK
jgi:hypothetical protein